MALFKSENPKTDLQFDENGIIPAHVAIIMDGNGRWAKKKLMPRVYGHKEGMNTVKKITIEASRLNVKVLTLYAFSTENWKRPTDEVNFLMGLPIDFFDVFMPELMQNNIKVTTIGWRNWWPTCATWLMATCHPVATARWRLSVALRWGMCFTSAPNTAKS